MFGAITDFNQSLEMFKTMWGQNAAATPGAGFMPDLSASMSGFQGAMPGFDIAELDKRIYNEFPLKIKKYFSSNN